MNIPPMGDLSLMPLKGKHYGNRMIDVPAGYLLWALDEVTDLKERYPRLYEYIVRHKDLLEREVKNPKGYA